MNRTTGDGLADRSATQPRDPLIIVAEEADGGACSPPASADETMYTADSIRLGVLTGQTDAQRKPAQRRATPVTRRVAIAARTSALVAGLMLLLAGCITSGTVTEKSSDLGRVSCSFDPLDCGHSGECWRLHLENEQGHTGRVCVPLEDWLLTDVGDYYDGPTVIQ